MGELGFGHLQKGIVRRIIIEAVLTKKLEKMNCNSMNFWIQAIENDDDQGKMWSYWQDTCEYPNTYDELGNKKASAENNDKAEDENNEGDNQSDGRTGSKDKGTVDELGHTQTGNKIGDEDTDARGRLEKKIGHTESDGKDQDNGNLSGNKVDVKEETNETKERDGEGNVAEGGSKDKPMTGHKDNTDLVSKEVEPISTDADKFGRKNDHEDDPIRSDSNNDEGGKEIMSPDTKADDNSNAKRYVNDDDVQRSAVDRTDSKKEAELPEVDKKPPQELSTTIEDGKDKNKSKDNSNPSAAELKTDVVKPKTGLTAKSGDIDLSAQKSSAGKPTNKAKEKQTLLELSKQVQPKHKDDEGTRV